MKRLFQIFEFTKNEQRVVLIIMLILVAIAFVAYERRVHQSPVEPALLMEPEPSPTAVETVGDQ